MKIINKKFSEVALISYGLYFCLFCSVCIIYYLTFVNGYGFVYEPISGWINPVNIHDHYIYLDYIEKIDNLEDLFGLNNNLGISIIYYLLHQFIYLLGFDIKYEVLALVINLAVLLAVLSSYINIVKLFGLPGYYGLTFFFMTSLVYFSQLINKDSFTILIVLKAIELAKNKHWRNYILLIGLSVFIRFQLPALLLLYAFIVYRQEKQLFRIAGTYILLSLINGFLAKYQTEFFNESTLSDGLSYYVYQLNLKYYIGSIIFNPLRVMQYFYDVLLSFNFIDSDYKIDVSRLKNIPQLFTMILLLPFAVLSVINFRSSLKGDERYFLNMLFCFFIIWLFNPTINQRYFICFLPILQLLSLTRYYNFRRKFQ